MNKIQYAPIKGNGVGNETPFIFDNPYRRIRKDKGNIDGYEVDYYFVVSKGKKCPVTDFMSLDDWDSFWLGVSE